MDDKRVQLDLKKTKALIQSPRLFSKYCLKVPVKANNVEEDVNPFSYKESMVSQPGDVALDYLPAQLELYKVFMLMFMELGYVALDIVKSRQVGSSTLWLSIMYHMMTFRRNFIANLICDSTITTSFLNNRLENFWLSTPDQFRQEKIPAKGADMKLANGTEYYSMTAGTKTSGRGGTPRFVIASEIAHFPNYEDIMDSIFDAISLRRNSGNVSIRESTSNGEGTGWHDHVIKSLRGETEYRVAFVNWLMDPNCVFDVPPDFRPTTEEEDLMKLYPRMTPEKVMFRRKKLASKSLGKFKQEFPLTIQESFEGTGEKFFPSVLVKAAMETELEDEKAPVAIGADSARTNDRPVIAVRRGRELLDLLIFDTTFEDMKETVFAENIAHELNKYPRSRAFLDPAYAWGCIDILLAKGFEDRVIPVYFQGEAYEDRVYYNKRAEMFHRLLKWLKNPPVSLPNIEDIANDLAAMPSPTTRGGRLLFPPKEEIKKLLKKSTDILDAISLTFAEELETEIGSMPILYGPDGGMLESSSKSGLSTKDYLKKFDKRNSDGEPTRLYNVHKY